MKNVFDLSGKVALVVGGGGGIGCAIAKGLAFYGAKVTITGRTEQTLETACKAIGEETGKDVDYIVADVTQREGVSALKDELLKRYGTIDILVNSQGVNRKFPAIESLDHLDEWDEMFATNVKSIMLCCVEFGQIMCEKRYGKIINVSSIRGSRAVKNSKPGTSAYGITKGAVDMLTKYYAGEWGEYNVTVNAIGPIVTMTNMMKAIPNPERDARMKATVPMGRAGEPDDNIGPAVFLASDASSFVSGQVIYPDGGLWSM